MWPALTITNNGTEVISLLAVHVVAFDGEGRLRYEWTEVVATPIAIEDELRGLLMPGQTRHALVDHWHHLTDDSVGELTAEVDVSEIRLWEPLTKVVALGDGS